jgi:phosphomevalonate kinase
VNKNKFVHLALERTLQVTKEINGVDNLKAALARGLDIAILGGNDFYSQRAQLEKRNLPRTLKSLESIPPFVPLEFTIENAHKTGMGSSAALITSLVAALMVHLGAVNANDIAEVESKGRKLIHNVAQYIHCFAQGKVGSGFDVAAAIFGSHVYTRFDPDVIAPLMSTSVSGVTDCYELVSFPIKAPDTSIYGVASPDNVKWDYQIKPFRLPPLTRLLLADVDAGSDSPSMASKVLKWRKENPAEGLCILAVFDSNLLP